MNEEDQRLLLEGPLPFSKKHISVAFKIPSLKNQTEQQQQKDKKTRSLQVSLGRGGAVKSTETAGLKTIVSGVSPGKGSERQMDKEPLKEEKLILLFVSSCGDVILCGISVYVMMDGP